ncbi:11823_t:CDS:2 [Funneliformis mosseae]|uniref:11823_t:CDS:1 n=1 Tax=Funneliformis mosseae TaxID=27381 RepID=A0A9N9CAQ8_FUNMO|nr:11823_t:CDS:2 [Funneliformis mosseae]
MSTLNNFFSNLSASTGGASTDHLKVVFTLLASYPIAIIYKYLPSRIPAVKHLFSITISIIVLFYVFDLAKAFYTMVASSLISYLIMYYVRGAWGPKLVFLCSLGHLSVNHLYRQLNDISYDRYDTTGPQMVLVIKLTSFAFNVYDGRRPINELTSYQRSKAIPSIPSILEFFGYIFFFGGFLVGPAFEFMDYRRFTNMEMFRIENNSTEPERKDIKSQQDKLVNRHNNNNVKYHVPNGFISAMSKLSFGIFWILCLVTIGNKYPFDWTLTEEFKNISFLDKLLYIQLASFCARFKYYIVWLVAEGACILSGLGFNGYDEHGNAKWNRVSNVDIIAYETADNVKTLLEAWNMNTNKWLKNYVYLRVTPPGKKPSFVSTFTTFGISAIWHGFYPGYYLTFISGAFVQSIHRTLRRHIRPIFLTPRFKSLKPLYNFFGWLFTQTMIHYIILPFNILSLSDSLKVWESIYFSGHLTIVLVNLIFLLGIGKAFKKIVQIGDGIENEELKGKKDQIKKWKVGSKEFDGEGKVAVTETGIPLEVDNGLVGLKEE